MSCSRSFLFRMSVASALIAGVSACEAPFEGEPRSESPESVTSTTTSTTATGTTATSTTGTSTAAPLPEPEPEPEPPMPACGDGVLDADEHCDDGNTDNLDACDSTCQFEQVLRFNSLKLRFATDTFCRANALGMAIGSAARETVQTSIADAIRDGSISTLCQFRELNAFDGGDTSSSVGCMTGAPIAHASYNGTSDLDWWYLASPSGLDAMNVPTTRLLATLLNGRFTAGPGNIVLSLSLGGGSSELALSSVLVKADVSETRLPRIASTLPRGHRAEENLDPSLQTFSKLSNGLLCGNVSAASLATLPVPETLQEGGDNACWEGYGAHNSMLDVFVGGCSIFFVTPIAATQPDTSDPHATVGGSGAPYRLTAGSDKRVNGCTDRRGARVTLSRCLSAAAYSVGVEFGAGRVMVIGVED